MLEMPTNRIKIKFEETVEFRAGIRIINLVDGEQFPTC